VQASDFYYENGIETRFGVRATRADAADKAVELGGGERLVYDKLLVATGGSNRRVPIPGISLDGIYGLRTVADSDRIRVEIAPGARRWWGWASSARRWQPRSGNQVWKSRSWIGTRCRCAGS
jgi:3-phenylpropionate/trans-cinnamate dioxygenase ferredoxin reductase subunit